MTFDLPKEAFEVDSDQERTFVHFEIQRVKPKGSILIKPDEPFRFLFSAGGPSPRDGIFARADDHSLGMRTLTDQLERYPKFECLVMIPLLQCKIFFVPEKHILVAGSNPKSFHMPFPLKFWKMHRRKYIRIPFNDTFPAELKFQYADGTWVSRKIRDLSREGLRVRLEANDLPHIKTGERVKSSTLKILDREMPIGLQVVSIYPGSQVGLKMIALSEDDHTWLRDMIRILMKQILQLKDEEIIADERGED